MTITTSISRSGPYAGAGTTGPFPVTFRFLQDSHLKVVLTDPSSVETILVLNVGYTVLGAGGVAGSVTTTAPVALGYSLTVVRNVPYTQETDYTQSDPFPAQSHEDALDKLTMLAQQLSDKTDRSIRVPEQIALPDLPAIASRANMLLAFDSLGNPSVLVPVSGSAADVLIRLANTSDLAEGDALIGVKQALTGAVGRTQHDKNAEMVSVKDFGAVGDDVADDTAAILAALAAHSNVYLTGTHKVSGKITVPANKSLRGDMSMSIKPTAAFDVVQINRGSQVTGFTIDCRGVAMATSSALLLMGWDAIEPLQDFTVIRDMRLLGGPPPALDGQGLRLYCAHNATGYSVIEYLKVNNVQIHGFRDQISAQVDYAGTDINFINGNEFTELSLIQGFRPIRLINNGTLAQINSGNAQIAINRFEGVIQHYTGTEYCVFADGAGSNIFDLILSDWPASYHYSFSVKSLRNECRSMTSKSTDVQDASAALGNSVRDRFGVYAMAVFNGVTPALTNAFGFSAFSRASTGNYTLTFEVPLPNTAYVIQVNGITTAVSNSNMLNYTAKTVNGFDIQSHNTAGVYADLTDISVVVFARS